MVGLKKPKDFAVDKYRAGATQAELSEEYGVTLMTIYRWIKDAGLNGTRKGQGPAKKSIDIAAAVSDLNERNYPVTRIASRYGVSPSTLKRRLEEAGYQKLWVKHG